jgi:hypothetical protein
MNKTETENKQRTIILENVRNYLSLKDFIPCFFKENRWVGIMFASKAFVQLITNPFIGPLTNR